MPNMTRHDFELLCAAAALAGLRNPREDQYAHQIQERAQVIADAFEARGFFRHALSEGDAISPPERYAGRNGSPGGGPVKKVPPAVVVGTGKPGEGISSKRAIVVNQTMIAPGKGSAAAPTVAPHQQKGIATQNHQTSNTTPKPKLVPPRHGPPTVVVGGAPQPRIAEPAVPPPPTDHE